MNNTFVWADLSTFDITETKRFYHQCFGWSYQAIDDDYVSCNTSKFSTAGMYTMPEKFQKIGMPSFWMSYIQVSNIEDTVRKAEEHGAIIEISPQAAPGGGLIALIRDPAGAGFTCYQGDALGGEGTTDDLGSRVWHELHVSDLELVESFYTHVFDWHIKPAKNADRYEIFSSANSSQAIAGVQVSSNDLKGDKEYWGVYFSVRSLSEVSTRITRHSGEVVIEQSVGDRPSLLAYDPQGAAFYIVENTKNRATGTNKTSMGHYKWRAIAGLTVVALAVLLDANWLWGVLFLLWVIPDLKTGSTHFIEHVERRDNPITFWLILGAWITLSIYLIANEAYISWRNYY